jgi:hypothetical protein
MGFRESVPAVYRKREEAKNLRRNETHQYLRSFELTEIDDHWKFSRVNQSQNI